MGLCSGNPPEASWSRSRGGDDHVKGFFQIDIFPVHPPHRFFDQTNPTPWHVTLNISRSDRSIVLYDGRWCRVCPPPHPLLCRELRCIAEALPSSRQTLLFSATMTSNLEALESLALTNPVKYDLTKKVMRRAAV